MADKRISQLVERTDIANNDVVAIVASGATVTNKATISSIQSYMQTALDVGVTSVGVTIGESGSDVNVVGSPITTSGNITINIPSAGVSERGVLTSEDYTSFLNKQNTITLTTSGTSGAATFDGSALNIPNYSPDLTGFVPYTGATGSVDLGVFLLYASKLVANGVSDLSQSGSLLLKQLTNEANNTVGYTTISVSGSNSINFGLNQDASNSKIFSLSTTSLTSNVERTYTLQDASGTLAFTSDIPSLAGFVTLDTAQTITGEKTFTNNIILKNSALAGLIVSSFSPNALEIGATLAGITYYSSIVFPAGDQSWNLPNASGTIALTSDLGAYVTLGTAQTITAQKTISTSGGDDTLIVNHTSGSGIALDIAKAGNGEGLRVAKSSGSGNAVTITGGLLSAEAATLTGALNGTSASFSSTLGVTGAATFSSSVTIGASDDILRFGNLLRWGFQRPTTDNRYVSFVRNANATAVPVWTVDGDNGNVGIGTDSPDNTLHVVKDSSSPIRMERTGGSAGFVDLALFGAGGSNYFALGGDRIHSGQINNLTTASGVNVVIGTDSNGITNVLQKAVVSSLRYKEEIKDWTGGLDIVMALKPRTFKYKKDYYNNADVDFLGLIAEEVSEVCPYLVDYENEDRTGQEENVRYANIVVPLIKAIQEQQEQIDSLKNQMQ